MRIEPAKEDKEYSLICLNRSSRDYRDFCFWGIMFWGKKFLSDSLIGRRMDAECCMTLFTTRN